MTNPNQLKKLRELIFEGTPEGISADMAALQWGMRVAALAEQYGQPIVRKAIDWQMADLANNRLHKGRDGG